MVYLNLRKFLDAPVQGKTREGRPQSHAQSTVEMP